MRSAAKRTLSMVLALCLCSTMLPAMATQTEAATSYDANAAIAYAAAHAADTPEIAGADCANFVSKCVSAGGIPVSQTVCHNLMLALKPYASVVTNLEIVVSGGYGRVPTSGSNASILSKGDVMFVCCERCKSTGNNYERHAVIYSGEADSNGYAKCYAHTSMANNTTFWVGYNGTYACSNGHSVSYLAAEVVHFDTSVPVEHTVDSSYGTNFTAYPKAKITAENIFNEYHSQINSTSWIGTSDKCTIHEVYTDGCCKVTYPLDAGGTKTVYSKISLFNTHTHDYSGTRVYESAHPHAIKQRCVDYATCGGWKYTGKYHELKTCEQCWHADFSIGESSVSLKIGESKSVSVSLSGCLPDSAVAYPNFSPDNGVAEVTIEDKQATFTGLKEGTTYLKIHVYSDSSKSYLINAVSIRVDVAAPTYTVSYNANGGSGAPSSQTKSHGTALTLSNSVPTRFGYNFLGWSTSSTATSASYYSGGSFSTDANTTLYAVWSVASEISGNYSGFTRTASIKNAGTGVYYKFVPYTSTYYRIYGTAESDSKVYLYDEDGNQLAVDDDSGSGNQFQLDYSFTAGETYYVYVRFYSSSAIGLLDFEIAYGYPITYNANGGSGAPGKTYRYYGFDSTLSTTAPTRTGYTFAGWGSSASATSAAYQPGDAYSGNSYLNLYAVWKPNTYTVSYNANGGTGAPSSQTKTHGTALTLSTTVPTRTGYTFAGWANSSTAFRANCQPGDTYTDNSSITLYAVWEVGCEGGNHSYDYFVTTNPTVTTTGQLKGICYKCFIGTTFVTLPKLNTTDYSYKVIEEPSYTATGTGRYTWKTTTYGTFYFDVTLDKLIAYLTKIEVASNPAKTVYKIGESLDTTGLAITATYSDGSVKYVYGGITCSPTTLTTAGTQRISASYGGKTTTFSVTVIAGKTISGNVTSFGGETEDVTIRLIPSGETEAAYTVTVQGNSASFTIENVEAGTYTMVVSKKNHVAREYTVTVGAENVTQNVKIHLLGDVNGNGRIQSNDLTMVYAHVSGTALITDSYILACADVNGNGRIQSNDISRILGHVSGDNPLW